MEAKVRNHDGYTIVLQSFTSHPGGEPGWTSMQVYGPQGGFRINLDLSPETASELIFKLKELKK